MTYFQIRLHYEVYGVGLKHEFAGRGVGKHKIQPITPASAHEALLSIMFLPL